MSTTPSLLKRISGQPSARRYPSAAPRLSLRPKSLWKAAFQAQMATAVLAGAAQAASLTWTATNGAWDLSATNWNGPAAWTQTDTTTPLYDAVFAGSDGSYIVTLGSTQIATSGLTFNNSGYTITSGTLCLGGTATVSVATGKTGAIASVISGTSGIFKSGSGTLTLSGSNTYSGVTTLSSGSLQLSHVAALGTSGSLTFSGGAILALNYTGTTATPIYLAGSGTQTITVLTGKNPTLTGGITTDGSAGILTIDGSTVSKVTHNLTFDSATLTLGAKSFAVQAGTANGATDSAAQKTTLNNSTLTTSADVQVGRTTLVIGGTSTVTIGGKLKCAASGDWGVVTMKDNAVVTAAGGVDINGLSKWGVNLTGGTLNTAYIRSGDNGGTSIDGNIMFNGTRVVATGGTSAFVSLSNGTKAYIGNNGALIDSGTNSIGIGIVLANATGATGSLTKYGTGTLTFSGSNTYTGATSVSTGTLKLAKTVSLYGGNTASWTASNLTVASGATLALSVGGTAEFAAADIDTLKALGTGSTGFSSGASLGFDTTNAASGAFTYGAAIGNPNGGANSLGLVKLGTGTLTLSGSNTYTGATSISAGTLQLAKIVSANGGNTASWTNSSLVVSSGAMLTLNVGGTGEFAAADIGNLAALGTGTTGFSSGASLGLDTTNAAGGIFTCDSAIGNPNGGANALSIVKLGTGMLVLTNTNSYTGVTTVSSGTLQLGNGGATGSISGSSAIANNATLVFNRSDMVTQGVDFGIISGTGSLVQAGSGTVILTGSNSFTGITTVSSGTLQLGIGGTTGSIAGSAITNNGALVFNRSDAVTQGTDFGAISGIGSLTKNGAGLLTLTSSNAYTGGTILSSGTLQLNHAVALGASSSLTINPGATLALSYTGTTANPLYLSGSGTQTLLALTGTQNLTGGITTDGSAGILTIDGTGSTSGLIHNLTFDGASLTLGAKSLLVQGNSSSTSTQSPKQKTTLNNSTLTTGSDVLVGRAALVISGTSAVTIGGKLKASGGSSGDWGSVTVQDTATVTATGGVDNNGASAWALNLNGGTLNTPYIRSNDALITGIISLNGTRVVATSSTSAFVSVSNGSKAYIGNSGALIDSGTNSIGIAVGLANATSATGSLTKYGTGTLTLSGSNTYTGATSVTAGTLKLTKTASLYNGDTASWTASNLTVAGGATLALSVGGTGEFAAADIDILKALGTGSTGFSSGASLTLDTTNAPGAVFTYDSAIGNPNGGANALSLVKLGTGMLVLTNSNSYTGVTTVSSGTLQLGNGGATGSISGSSAIANNGTLAFDRSDTLTQKVDFGIISGTGSLVQAGTGTVVLTGSNTFTKITTNANGILQIGSGGATGSVGSSAITNNGALIIDRSDTVTQGVDIGAISGTGSLVQAGSGTLILAGTTTLSGATINLGSTLQFNNGAKLTGSSAIVNNGLFAISRSATLTQGTDFGIISGSGALTQTGGYTFLNAANTYTGDTSLNAGTVLVSGTEVPGVSGPLGNGGKINFGGDGGTLYYYGALTTDFSSRIASGTSTAPVSVNLGSNDVTFATPLNSNQSGGLIKYGSGTLTLTGTQTFGGDLSVDDGTLVLTATTRLGTGTYAGNIYNAGSIQITTTGTRTYSGTISGPGSWNFIAGTTLLTGTNSLTGLITISSNGTVQVSSIGSVNNPGNLGTSGTIGLTGGGNAGTLIYTGSGETTDRVFNLATGQGSFATGRIDQSGSGLLKITGNVIATGGATHTLELRGSTSGQGEIAGVISDNTAIRKTALLKSGSGLWTLSGTNTYTGTTTVSSGTLQIGNGITDGDISSSQNIVNNAKLAFNRTSGSTFTYGQVISGSGALIKSGNGTQILAGSNSYSGGTSVNAGVLNLGTDAALGATSGTVTLNGGTLQTSTSFAFNAARSFTVASGTGTLDTQGNNNTIAGSLSGAGTLAKSGSGTLVISGSIGIGGLSATEGAVSIEQSGTIGALTVGANSTVTLTAHTGAYKVIETSSLSIAAGANIDLWNNAMILRASGTSENATNLTTVKAAVNAASNGLQWNGSGLGSTTASNEAGTGQTQALALMVYDNTVITQSNFEGVSGLGYFDEASKPVGYNQVLVKLTYLGDFNADGMINASDYTWLDGFALSANPLGDLNGDGFVNATDYTWLDGSALNQSFGVLAGSSGAAPSAVTASGGGAPASPEAVPEPGVFGMLLAAATSLLGTRRKFRANRRS